MPMHRDEEIDLSDLFFKFILIVQRFRVLLIICLLIGGLLGGLYTIASKKIYKSKLIFSTSLFTLTHIKELTQNINTLLEEHNTVLVAKQLNISEDYAKKINRIEAVSGYDEKEDVKDTQVTLIKIVIETTSPALFQILEKGIVNYFESNPYSKIRYEQRIEYLKQVIKKLDEELADLTQLKERMINGQFYKEANGNVMFDPTIVNSKILELSKERITLEQSLALSNYIQVIDPLQEFNQPKWPRPSVSIGLGIIGGIFVFFGIVMFKLTNEELQVRTAKLEHDRLNQKRTSARVEA